jgi:hypothetical protein
MEPLDPLGPALQHAGPPLVYAPVGLSVRLSRRLDIGFHIMINYHVGDEHDDEDEHD